MTELTQKQELFAQKFIETGNASEAYRLAYDAANMSDESVWVEASRLLQNPKVAPRVEELRDRLQKRHDITVDRVLREYSRLAFLDIRKVFDEEGNLKPIHELDDDTVAAISGIEVEVRRVAEEVDEEFEAQPHGGALRRQHGTTARLHKIKLSDKKGALDSLSKYLGICPDTLNVTVTTKPLPEQDRAILEDYAGSRAD